MAHIHGALSVRLAALGWRKKIYLFAGVITSCTIAVGLVGTLAVAYFNHALQDVVGSARERAEVAALARLSVIGIDRAQARLQAAASPAAIRTEAIAAIRAATYLEESLQTLARVLPGEALVAELVALHQQVKEPRIAIIKAVKGRQPEAAAEQSRMIGPALARIEEVSSAILAGQQDLLAARVREMGAASRNALLLLGVFIALGVVVSAFACVLFARMLGSAIGQMQGGEQVLNGNAGQVADIAAAIADCETRSGQTVARIRTGMDAMRDATEQSGAQLASATGRIEAMSTTVSENARQVGQVVQRFTVMHGTTQNAIEKALALRRSVGSIGEIAGAIDVISRQTNMLAINAAIEAARAGEVGRGFAVVAAEVRTLAQRSGEATRSIHTLAASIGQEVAGMVDALTESNTHAAAYAGQLNEVLGNSDAARASGAEVQALMGQVAQQMAGQRDTVLAIDRHLGEVQEATRLSALEVDALGGVSRALTGSAASLGMLAGQLRL
ncbi:MAG: methyl-accepting chemotaxis protein [Telluria sp.]|nr:methyl-accepting chemotaxis protein [Telluria sp.]